MNTWAQLAIFLLFPLLNAFKFKNNQDLERLQNLIKAQIIKDPYVQEVTFSHSGSRSRKKSKFLLKFSLSTDLNANLKEEIYREKKVFERLKANGIHLSTGIVHAFSFFISPQVECVVLVMRGKDIADEQESLKNLQNALKIPAYANQLKRNPRLVKKFFFQLALNLNSLNENGIFHNNLIPVNVALNGKNEPEIVNFSQSYCQEPTKSLEILSVPEFEVPKNNFSPSDWKVRKCYTYKKDWFSYGRILMLVQRQVESFHKDLDWEFDVDFRDEKDAESAFEDKEFASLVYHLTRLEEEKRFDFALLSTHAYFQGVEEIEDDFDVTLIPPSKRVLPKISGDSPIEWGILLFVLAFVTGTIAGLMLLQQRAFKDLKINPGSSDGQ